MRRMPLLLAPLFLSLPLAAQAARPPAGACALVTAPEVQQAVGSAVIKTTQKDTVLAGVHRSRCLIRVKAGITHAVTVDLYTGLPPVADAAALAHAVSEEGMEATPATGYPWPAAEYADGGVVFGQRGKARVSVVAFNITKARALAAHAIPRLP